MAKKRARHKRKSLHREVLIVFGLLLFFAGLLKACAPAPPQPEPSPPTPLLPPSEPAPSPIEEVEEEVTEEEEKVEEPEIVEEKPVEPVEEVLEESEIVENESNEVTPTTTHTVQLTKEGFVPETLTINAGDTVVWENQRQINNLKTALLVGNFRCKDIKSPLMDLGEQYQYTFTKIGKCDVLDTITKYALMRITIE